MPTMKKTPARLYSATLRAPEPPSRGRGRPGAAENARAPPGAAAPGGRGRPGRGAPPVQRPSGRAAHALPPAPPAFLAWPTRRPHLDAAAAADGPPDAAPDPQRAPHPVAGAPHATH